MQTFYKRRFTTFGSRHLAPWFTLFLLMVSLSIGQAQQYDKRFHIARDKVIVNLTESVVYASILPVKSKFQPRDDRYYHWFAVNDIKRTRGGYDGKLLHGVCKEFFLNKNLKQVGKYRKGIKTGRWKEWYYNGEYKDITSYKKGLKSKYTLYNEQGNITEKGNYKKGKLHGKLLRYQNSKVVERHTYKKGIELFPKPKKGKRNAKDSLSVANGESDKNLKIDKKKSGKKDKMSIKPMGKQPPTDTSPKRSGKKKSKEPQIKIKRFLWIFPLSEKPSPEKQT